MATLFIVEDDDSQTAALQRVLGNTYSLRIFRKGDDLFESAPPEILLCDLHLPEGDQGLEILKKAAAVWPTTARVLMSGSLTQESLIDAINHELAHRILRKPWSPDDLKTAISEASSVRRLLLDRKYWQELSLTDPLTHLWNRRGLLQQLLREGSRSRRNQNSYSLLMIDVDHFKNINDEKGHLHGDETLRKIARLFAEGTRAVDWVCRFGGDEFAIILSETGLAPAKEVAERLRTKVKNELGIGLSIGLASFPDHGEDPGNLLQAADSALFTAKSRGRFQTAIAAAPECP